MDTEKLDTIFKNINNILIENKATLDDVATLGINLIAMAWRCNSDKETLIEPYIEHFSKVFKEITSKILEEEKEE